ncbi:hypothetical protein Pmani_018680 [Petrolisthes manimaculis]|uniref:PKD domain-containing protein n=1 Tax=Petrolisthes manimaculis TaxID=1843537 RepID=A0AAE1PME7_9EUCA|nr:hypothetical protein Pmani_018680 [Petrolisthes manimaculis]
MILVLPINRTSTSALVNIDLAPVQLFENHDVDMYIEIYEFEEDAPYVIDWGDGVIFHDTIFEEDEQYAYNSHRYHDPGDYKVTVAVYADDHIFYERILVWVWDKHLKAHQHVHDECVYERVRSQRYDLALRWFYISVLFLIILLLVALIIIAWLLGCSVCALKKI